MTGKPVFLFNERSAHMYPEDNGSFVIFENEDEENEEEKKGED